MFMRSVAGKTTLLVILVLLVTATVVAQEGTIKSRTEVVLVPTIVTDKAGNHISGLKKEDFIIKESGKERPIASVEEITIETKLTDRTPENGIYSNFGEQVEGPKKLTVIALDLVNTNFEDHVFARNQIIKFLEKGVPPNELVALLAIERRGIGVIHDFSTSSNVLLEALRAAQIIGGGSGQTAGIGRELTQRQVDLAELHDPIVQRLLGIGGAEAKMDQIVQRHAISLTLGSLESIAQSLASVPGRKSLVWVTGGFPFNMENPSEFIDLGVRDEAERTFQALNDSNISVYPVDARGLAALVPVKRLQGGLTYTERDMGDLASQRDYSPTGSMRLIAERTGGEAYYNTNDLPKSFARASADSGRYYMISYAIDRDNKKKGWRKLDVKVNREKTEVRARTGYYYLGDQQKNSKDQKKDDLNAAVNSPLDLPGVPLSIQFTGIEPDKAAFAMLIPSRGVTIETEKSNHIDLDFVIVAKGATGQIVDTVSQTWNANIPPQNIAQVMEQGVSYTNYLKLKPGAYQVKFIARDNLSGRTGSVTAPVTVK